MKETCLILAIVFSVTISGKSQVDTLVFKNNVTITGEIKSMTKGVIQFETDYSDSDFKIEWDKVKKLYTSSYLFISLSNGKNLYGYLRTISDTSSAIINKDSIQVICRLREIVHILPVKKGFKDRFSANIDLGLSLTKANNLKQLTTGTKIGYKTEKWTSYITLNSLFSIQDESDPIRRNESDFVFQYVLYKNWYLIPSTKYLSNTEQNLKYRWTGLFGAGNYLVRTNSGYWGILVGINRNREYTDETPARSSWEGAFGSELYLFDIGDLEMFMKIVAFPGIDEKGRWRFDGNLNIKYDLPLDFYIKLGGSINFDNRPAETGNKLDYVIQTGFGWEW